MVIAQIIGDLRIGGAERLFVDLSNALADKRVIVVLINNEVAVEPNLAKKLDRSIQIVVCPVRRRSLFVDLPRLARLLRKFECDVVHTHMFWANLYGSIAARLAGIPVTITSEHGRNEWKRPWHKWLESKIISRLSAMRLCVSQDILDRRRDVDGIPADKLTLVPNGTIIPENVTQNHGKEVIIGSVGRLVREKDYPSLVKAFAELIRAGADCRLEIVGEGPARKDIQMQIDANGLGRHVRLPGVQEDVGQWLRRWSIFAISSIQEGQPIALLEAMAHGLPCVGTNVGGVPDTMEDGKEGIVVEAGDINGLAEAIRTLILNPDLRVTLGHAARRRAIRDFSIEALAQHCTEVYQNALASEVD